MGHNNYYNLHDGKMAEPMMYFGAAFVIIALIIGIVVILYLRALRK